MRSISGAVLLGWKFKIRLSSKEPNETYTSNIGIWIFSHETRPEASAHIGTDLSII